MELIDNLNEVAVREMANETGKREFRIGDYISKAFEFTKAHLGTLVVINLVYFLLVLLLTLTLVGMLALPALTFGYAEITRKLNKGEQIQTSDLFSGFDHFGKLLQVGLLYFLVFLIIALPILIAAIAMGLFANQGAEEFAGFFAAGMILLYIPLFLLAYAFQTWFAVVPHFAVYGNMSALDAFKNSFRFTKKNFWYWLLLLIIGGFMASLGIYACYIGAIFTIHALPMIKAVAFFDQLEGKIESVNPENYSN